MPGRREKLLQAKIDELRAELEAAPKLLQALLPENARSAAKLEKAIRKAERRIEEVLAKRGWPEDLEDERPGRAAFDLLTDAGVLDGIDWKGAPDELRACLDPLLKRRGLALDWTFVADLEAIGNGEQMRNPVFLPVVGDHVEKLGHVLALVVDGADSYTFAVCTPQEFERIENVECRSFKIRRISSATGPVPEP